MFFQSLITTNSFLSYSKCCSTFFYMKNLVKIFFTFPKSLILCMLFPSTYHFELLHISYLIHWVFYLPFPLYKDKRISLFQSSVFHTFITQLHLSCYSINVWSLSYLQLPKCFLYVIPFYLLCILGRPVLISTHKLDITAFPSIFEFVKLSKYLFQSPFTFSLPLKQALHPLSSFSHHHSILPTIHFLLL